MKSDSHRIRVIRGNKKLLLKSLLKNRSIYKVKHSQAYFVG